MKRIAVTAGVAAAVVAAFLGVARSPVPPKQPAKHSQGCQWAVYFSPRGGATQAIVSAVGGARRMVLVQAYSFTSAPIAKVLLEAHKRGVDVRVILDDSQANGRYSSARFFLNQGVPVRIDRAHAIAHNKIMIIDAATVITGSFNFTKAAEERNAENLLVIHDPKLVARYTANWKVHFAHSTRYDGRAGG